MAITTSTAPRSVRLELRATPEQGAVLRRAADVAHQSLSEFILESACHAAEQTLLKRNVFMVSGKQYQELMDLLNRPERVNAGLANLFDRAAPWDK